MTRAPKRKPRTCGHTKHDPAHRNIFFDCNRKAETGSEFCKAHTLTLTGKGKGKEGR